MVVIDELDPAHENAQAFLWVECCPATLCLGGILDDGVDIGAACECDFGLYLSGRRIINRCGGGAGACLPGSGVEMGDVH